MWRILKSLPVIAAVLVALPATAQVPRRSMTQNDRAALQQRVHARFMEILSRRLGLDDQQREKVSDILRKDMQDRMELAHRSMTARRRLALATADTATAPDRIQAILDDIDRLRQQETALAAREDSALATVLTPRQRAEFIILRGRFNERVRQIRGGMGGGRMRGQPPGGPPDHAPPGPRF